MYIVKPVNGVSTGRLRVVVAAAVVADVGDVETGVARTCGEVARRRQSRHVEPSTERRVAVDLDVGRLFTDYEQLIVE